MLDAGRTSAGRVGDGTRLDVAIDAALLLGALAAKAGDRVACHVRRQPRARAVGGGGVGRERVARVAAVDGRAAIRALVETDARAMAAAGSAGRGSARWWCCSHRSTTAAIDEGLLPVLPQLTRRHTVVVAAVNDPRIAELRASRGSLDAVYEAVAGEKAEEERRRTAETLRRHGVTVVDAVPEALAPALADCYLTLKSTGRL